MIIKFWLIHNNPMSVREFDAEADYTLCLRSQKDHCLIAVKTRNDERLTDWIGLPCTAFSLTPKPTPTSITTDELTNIIDTALEDIGLMRVFDTEDRRIYTLH